METEVDVRLGPETKFCKILTEIIEAAILKRYLNPGIAVGNYFDEVKNIMHTIVPGPYELTTVVHSNSGDGSSCHLIIYDDQSPEAMLWKLKYL